jgi:hypothetical protein
MQPLDAALRDIAEELRLSPEAQAVLRETVHAAEAQLLRYRTIQKNYAGLGGREGVIKYCKALEASLRETERHLTEANPLADPVLKTYYPRVLSTLLDHRAIGRYVRTDLTWGIEYLWNSSRIRIDRGEAFDAAMDELTQRKERAAEDRSRELLLGVMGDLAKPLRSYLAIERRNRGGRPKNAERDFIIDEMLAIFPQITGKAPTSSPAGPFVTLCDRVLEALGMETEGVESAVAKRLRAYWNRRRSASS